MKTKSVPYLLEAIDAESIQAIHAATLDVLSEAGVYIEEPEALDLLSAAGARVEPGGRVYFPPELVQKAIDSAPKGFRMYNRLGEEALRLEPGYVYCGTGSDCPHVIDLESGERRLATRADIGLFARLSDSLPNIDFVLSMGIASDVPPETADLEHFNAMVENTVKPVFFTVVIQENLQPILERAAEMAGGLAAVQAKPFAALFAMPSPPLRHSHTALHNIMQCARQGFPVVYASGTQMGVSGPVTLAGAVASSNCDVLAGLVVHQLACPGAPFVYGVCVPPIDMRTTIECYGAPEHYLGDLVNVQVARSYGLPTWGYAGDTDAKTLDLQAGMEYTGATLMGLLSGCNLLHDVGYLESGMTASCESILFGNEVIEFARRALQPVVVDAETLATTLIKKVGAGGTFLTEDHTLRHFREVWYSPLVDRQRYDAWVLKGEQTMGERLRTRVKRILAGDSEP